MDNEILHLILYTITLLVIWFGRGYILNWISNSIRYEFDIKLEKIRSENRQKEEALIQEIQSSGQQLNALRNNVLGGMAIRQELFEKRRVEAIESVWSATIELKKYNFIAGAIAILNFEEISKTPAPNHALQDMIKVFTKPLGLDNADKIDNYNLPTKERLYIPDSAWVYFQAYNSIYMYHLALAIMLQIGIHDYQKFTKVDEYKEDLKKALPEMSASIDDYSVTASYYLLPMLEEKLLKSLKNLMQGKDTDKISIEQVNDVVNLIAKMPVDPKIVEKVPPDLPKEFLQI